MKRILTIAFLLSLLFASANAQSNTAADAMPWSYGNCSPEDFYGLGTGAACDYHVAIFFPGSGAIKGSHIIGVEVPVTYAAIADLKVWALPTLTSTDTIFVKHYTGSLKEGFNQVLLNEECVVNGDMYIGYSFGVNEITADPMSKYPVATDANVLQKNTLFLAAAGDSFYDYGTQYGASALKVLLTGLQIPDANASLSTQGNLITLPGRSYRKTCVVASTASKAISSIEYVVSIDGKSTTHTANVSVPAGFDKFGELEIEVESPAVVKPYDVDVVITKVNGIENANTEHMVLHAENVSREVPTKVLVEEFTGTGCQFCPRGWVAMEEIKRSMSDIVVPIAMHQYDSSDPMLISQMSYAKIGFTGAPSAAINRTIITDPYYGTSGTIFGFFNDIRKYVGGVSPVDVTVSAELQRLTSSKFAVNATADVEFLGSIGAYDLEFVVTADSLTGSTNAWKQTNTYASYYPNQADAVGTELAEFCRGGKYAQSKAELIYNDVALVSSYTAATNKVKLTKEFTAGDKVNVTYSLALPTRTALLPALRTAVEKQNLYINAIVTDNIGRSVQVVRAKVIDPENIDGDNDGNFNGIVEVQQSAPRSRANGTYNLNGQRVPENYKGIVIAEGKKVSQR